MFTHTFTTSATASGDEEKLPVAMNGHHPWLKPIVALLLMLLSAAVGLCQPAVQEKVYLHLDNNCYHAGDTIWYAAYTVRADDNRPTDMSRILYVELLNEQGYLVERQQLVVDYDGRSHGQFALPDTAWAGYYEVRAYTKWMMNFRDRDNLPYMFSRVLPVYQKNDSTHNYKRKVMPRKITAGNYEITYPLPKFNIKFYPEGGHIVQGMETKVAFETSNEQTQRMNMTGLLLEDGEVIDTIRTSHGGRGTFTFYPMRGRTYKTMFILDGERYTDQIEGIEKEGVAMKVTQDENDVNAIIMQSGQLFADASLTLRAMCRGLEEMEARLRITDGFVEVKFPKKNMCEGVNEVVLEDSVGNILASRMVFIKGKEPMAAKPKVANLPKAMKPYEKQELRLDLGREFANTTVSLAVTDKGLRDQTYDASSIMTDLLLQSDVRGYVENAAWYFESDDEQHRAALDLLMLVQGWSRYDWGRQHDLGNLNFKEEKTTYVNCELQDVDESIWTKKRRKQRKAAFASLIMNDGEELFQGSIYADSEGRFTIAHKPFYGDAKLNIHAFYGEKLKKNAKYSKLIHDPKIFIRLEAFHPLNALKPYSWYETNQPDSLAEILMTLPDAIALSNVTVKSGNKWRYVKRKDSPVAAYDFNDFMNEYFDYDSDAKDFFGKDPFTGDGISPFPFPLFDSYLTRKMTNNYQSGQIVVTVLDNHFINLVTDDMDVMKMRSFGFIDRIDSVKIITDIPRRPMYFKLAFPEKTEFKTKTNRDGSFVRITKTGQLCGYKFYKKYPNDKERFVHGRHVKLHGFNRPAEFYSPDYSRRPLPDRPDHRHTLYWNPELKTDAEGKAQVEFYNNAVCTELHISTEGLTKDGRMIAN